MKYKNPNVSRDIIPFDWYIAWSKPIVLCEGVFDAMSIRSNAIPMLSKKPSKSLLRKIFEKKVKTIYIALDEKIINKSTVINTAPGVIKLKDKEIKDWKYLGLSLIHI